MILELKAGVIHSYMILLDFLSSVLNSFIFILLPDSSFFFFFFVIFSSFSYESKFPELDFV